MSKEFQIRDGNLIASFDLENEDGDIDFCKLLKVSHGVADEIGMFVDYVATNKIIKDQSKKIADLEAKLAEKDAERELDNSFWKQECDSLQKTLVEKDKEIENLTEELDDKNFCRDFVDLYTENRLKTQLLNENWKDKISFAIEQLEKVDEFIKSGYCFDLGDVRIEIDNQIKQLKEMK